MPFCSRAYVFEGIGQQIWKKREKQSHPKWLPTPHCLMQRKEIQGRGFLPKKTSCAPRQPTCRAPVASDLTHWHSSSSLEPVNYNKSIPGNQITGAEGGGKSGSYPHRSLSRKQVQRMSFCALRIISHSSNRIWSAYDMHRLRKFTSTGFSWKVIVLKRMKSLFILHCI